MSYFKLSDIELRKRKTTFETFLKGCEEERLQEEETARLNAEKVRIAREEEKEKVRIARKEKLDEERKKSLDCKDYAEKERKKIKNTNKFTIEQLKNKLAEFKIKHDECENKHKYQTLIKNIENAIKQKKKNPQSPPPEITSQSSQPQQKISTPSKGTLVQIRNNKQPKTTGDLGCISLAKNIIKIYNNINIDENKEELLKYGSKIFGQLFSLMVDIGWTDENDPFDKQICGNINDIIKKYDLADIYNFVKTINLFWEKDYITMTTKNDKTGEIETKHMVIINRDGQSDKIGVTSISYVSYVKYYLVIDKNGILSKHTHDSDTPIKSHNFFLIYLKDRLEKEVSYKETEVNKKNEIENFLKGQNVNPPPPPPQSKLVLPEPPPPPPPELNKAVKDCNAKFEALDKDTKLSNKQKVKKAMEIMMEETRCGADDTLYDEFYNKFSAAAEEDERDPTFGNKGPPIGSNKKDIPLGNVVKEEIEVDEVDVEKLKQDHDQEIERLKKEIQNIETSDKKILDKAQKEHEEALEKLTIEQNKKLTNLTKETETKQEQLQNQLNNIQTEKQRLQRQLEKTQDDIQDQEITKRQIERLGEVERTSKKSIEKNKSLIEQLKKEKEEIQATRTENQKAVIELMKIKEEERRKQKEEFLKHKGESLKEAIGNLENNEKFTNMSEIKIAALESYPTLHDKIKKFLVFKEDELIKAHHAKFYSDNIKRNNNKLVETLKLVPSEPFLGIEGLPLVSGFGSNPEQEEKPKEEEIESLKEIKKMVRDFIMSKTEHIFNPSQHEKLSVKEYLKTL